MRWFNTMAWDTLSSLPGQTFVQVPHRSQKLLASVQNQLVTQILSLGPENDASLPFWKALFLFSWLFLTRPDSAAETPNTAANIIDDRLTLWNLGLYETLYQQTFTQAKPAIRNKRTTRTDKHRIEAKVKKITTLTTTKEISRALDALSDQQHITVDQPVVRCIQRLYPTATTHPPYPDPPNLEPTEIHAISSWVPRALNKMGRLTQPGPLGMRPEHLHGLLTEPDYEEAFSHLVALIALGRTHPQATAFLRSGEIIPKPKGPDDYRPILLSPILRRLAIKALMMSEKENVANLTSRRQYGVGWTDGAAKLTKLIRALVDADPTLHVVSLDIKAAFQTISRAAVANQLDNCNHSTAHQAFTTWYPHNHTTHHRIHTTSGFSYIAANQGVDQGDGLAAYGYAKGTETALEGLERDLKSLCPSNCLVAYLDGTYIICRKQDIPQALHFAETRFGLVQQELQQTKIKIWSPRPSAPQDYPQDLQARLVSQLKCLGTYLRISGDPDNTYIELTDPARPFQIPAQRLTSITNTITQLQDHGLKRQIAITLLHSYTASAAQHIVRNYFVTPCQAREWDHLITASWEKILRRKITPSNVLQHLPRKLGGCGITDMQFRHDAAIWSAWTGALPHLIASLPQFHNIEELIDHCPNISQSLANTQQQLAYHLSCPALRHKPLHAALSAHVKHKQYLTRIQTHLHHNLHRSSDTVSQALLHSQSSTGAGAFLTAPPDEAHIMGDHNFSTSVLTRLHQPWAAYTDNPPDDDNPPTCTNLGAAGARCPRPLDRFGVHARICNFGGAVIRRHNAVVNILATLIHSITGSNVYLEKRTE